MFTSNGKTRCILDQEVDYAQYLSYSQQQINNGAVRPPVPTANPANPPTTPVVTNPASSLVVTNAPTANGAVATPSQVQAKVNQGRGTPQPLTPNQNASGRILVVPKNPAGGATSNINGRIRQQPTPATRRPPSTNPTQQQTVTAPTTATFITPTQQTAQVRISF